MDRSRAVAASLRRLLAPHLLQVSLSLLLSSLSSSPPSSPFLLEEERKKVNIGYVGACAFPLGFPAAR